MYGMLAGFGAIMQVGKMMKPFEHRHLPWHVGMCVAYLTEYMYVVSCANMF